MKLLQLTLTLMLVNLSSQQFILIIQELRELGGLENIHAELPEWPVSDDTVLHLATAEALATGWSSNMEGSEDLTIKRILNIVNCLCVIGKESEELLHEVAFRYVEGMKDMEGRKPGPSSILGKRPHMVVIY